MKWIYILFIALLGFQIYLNIAAYYAVVSGMKNFSLFIVGVMMLVFAGMFHLYRHGRSIAKAPPIVPKPVIPAKPFPVQRTSPSISATEPAAKQLAPPPEVQKSSSGQQSQPSSSTRTDGAKQAGGAEASINKAQTITTGPTDDQNMVPYKSEDREKHRLQQ